MFSFNPSTLFRVITCDWPFGFLSNKDCNRQTNKQDTTPRAGRMNSTNIISWIDYYNNDFNF